MKIAFFTDYYLPTSFGVTSSIQAFKKSLEKLGHKVYIFAPYFKNYKDKEKDVFRFHSLRFIKEPEIRVASFFPKNELREFKGLSFDIIHAHTPFSMGILAKSVSIIKGIPLVYTHHTQYKEYAKYYLKEKHILPYIAKSITALFCNMSDAVISPSFKTAKELKDIKVRKPIYIIQTGINIKRFKNKNKDKALLFVGRIGKEKNIDFLIKAKEQLKGIKLLIIGDGPYKKELQKKTKDKEIHFLGYKDYSQMPKYYQKGNIFVFSSLTDTQGIVILEAMASGLPVVVLKDDAFKDIVINNKNGFQAKNKKEFVEKIEKILNNKNLYNRLSKNAVKTAHLYSEENQAKKLVALYNKIIHSS